MKKYFYFCLGSFITTYVIFKELLKRGVLEIE